MSTSNTDHNNPNLDGHTRQTHQDIDQLNSDAAHHYQEAIRAESPYDVRKAIWHYEQAMAILQQLPYSETNRILHIQYWDRIQILRSQIQPEHKSEPKKEPNHTPSTITFNDVIGLDDAKQALRSSVLYPTERPDLYMDAAPRNILMYGPPGNGKSLLMSSVAGELKAVTMEVNIGSIFGRFYGDMEKAVSGIFEAARNHAKDNRLVVIIDEVDGLFTRHGSDTALESRLLAMLLSELDGVHTTNDFTILAATNRPWQLDSSMVRRFPHRVYVGLPDYKSRTELFRLHLSKMRVAELDYTRLSRAFDSYSSADIRQVCRDAQNTVVHELFLSPGYNTDAKQLPRKVTMDDIIKVKQHRRPSTSPDVIRSCQNWHRDYGGA